MKLHELNAYDPETRPVEHRLYRYGYDFGVALYCQGEEEGESA